MSTMLDSDEQYEIYKNAQEKRIAAEDRVTEHEREAYPYDEPERLEEYNRAHADLEREAEKAREAEAQARSEMEKTRDLERQAYETRMEGTRDAYNLPEGRDNDATEKLRHQMDDKELKWEAQDREIRQREEQLQREREEKLQKLEEERKRIWAENERKREAERVKYRAELERRKQEQQQREREESRSREDDERKLDRERGYGGGRSR